MGTISHREKESSQAGISGFCLQPLLLRGWSRGILLYLRLGWVAYQKYILAKQMSKSVIDHVFEVIISGKDVEEIALSETWFLHPRAVVAENMWLCQRLPSREHNSDNGETLWGSAQPFHKFQTI